MNINPFADPFEDETLPVSTSGARANPVPVYETNPANFSYQSQPHSYGTAAPSQENVIRTPEESSGQTSNQARNVESAPTPRPPNNWPPLPPCIRLQPCFYQDIKAEIPQQYQRIVLLAYALWLVYALVQLLHVTSCLVGLFAGLSGTYLLYSLLQLSILPPATFLFWFRPLYKAFRGSSSFNFMVFFLFCLVHGAAMVMQALGFFSVGWIVVFGAVGKHAVWLVLVYLVPTLGFTLCAAAMVFVLVKVNMAYRGTGASFARARQEMYADTRAVATTEASAAMRY